MLFSEEQLIPIIYGENNRFGVVKKEVKPVEGLDGVCHKRTIFQDLITAELFGVDSYVTNGIDYFLNENGGGYVEADNLRKVNVVKTIYVKK